MRHFEIERKFRISPFNKAEIMEKKKAVEYEFTQIYLKTVNKAERRIRIIQEIKNNVPSGDLRITYTVKRAEDYGKREEIETGIDCKEALRLMAEIDRKRHPLTKRRIIFCENLHYFEVDIYDKEIMTDWILEVELSKIDEELILPVELHVLEEVTGNKKYSNSELAKL